MKREEAIQILETQFPHDSVIREALATVIPEFQVRESEDEKIYREIYSIVHHSYQQKIDNLVSRERKKEQLDKWEKAKAWLEKQKEHKLANNSDFKVKLAEYMTKNCTGHSFNISSESILEMAKEELIKRGELKEQKPAWSEEDEHCQRQALNALDRNGFVLADWLNSLRPSQKQEWSEDDKEILDSVIRIITKFDDLAHEPTYAGPKWTHPYTKEIAWLKSLRPSWKPSKEQMDALHEAVIRSCSHRYGVKLLSLEVDLLNLK